MKIIKGTAEKPRLRVFRSLKFIYVQAIDDEKGHTIASSYGENPEDVGKKIAKKLGKKAVVFDRGKYKYHGRVKALAEAARKAGLKF